MQYSDSSNHKSFETNDKISGIPVKHDLYHYDEVSYNKFKNQNSFPFYGKYWIWFNKLEVGWNNDSAHIQKNLSSSSSYFIHNISENWT